MSNYTHVMRGELHLETITPVIKALFGRLNLDQQVDLDGVAKFHADAAYVNGELLFTWDDLSQGLLDLLSAERREQIEDASDTAEILWALASQFDQDDNHHLNSFIGHYIEGGGSTMPVDLGDLNMLAGYFNDGHGLKKTLSQGSWTDRASPLTYLCGGDAQFHSNKLTLKFSTHAETAFAQRLDECLQANDLGQAARQMATHFHCTINGIGNRETRDSLAFSSAVMLLDSLGITAREGFHLPLSMLYRLWRQLGDVYCTEATANEAKGDIKEAELLLRGPFLFFPKGTRVEAVWRWFESMNPRFIIGEVMQGVVHPDEANG